MPSQEHSNNFGILRLLFASLVVLSHSSELVDGSRARELLTATFGGITFGDVGVDGFFLISGYLITKSLKDSSSTSSYLLKRIARIYPAFIVATGISIFLFAPLGGTNLALLNAADWISVVWHCLLLQPPPVPSFAGLTYPILNGSMWTIAYEFRCYLLIAIFWHQLRFRFAVLAIGLSLLAIANLKLLISVNANEIVTGVPSITVRTIGLFLIGSAHYLYRDAISYNGRAAALAIMACLLFFSLNFVPEKAFGAFGGYVVFYAALKVGPGVLSGLANKQDISYGLYLYAWPIQNTICYFYRDISPWIMFPVSLLAAAAFGIVSWTLLESPVQHLVRAKRALAREARQSNS